MAIRTLKLFRRPGEGFRLSTIDGRVLAEVDVLYVYRGGLSVTLAVKAPDGIMIDRIDQDHYR